MSLTYKYLSALILISFLCSPTYAAWRKQCLDNCFSTKHDCDYCAWACESEEPAPQPNYSRAPCALEGYYAYPKTY